MHGSAARPVPLGLISTAIGAAIAVAVMDGVMIAVALPVIARELGASDSSIILVVGAYQLAIAALILPSSALASRWGLKRVYVGSIALLGIGALACALAPSLEMLIIARIVQGAGGAGITALTNALLRRLYPRDMLARAISINAAVAALALSGGPSLAALLLSLLSWHWLFLVNVPVALFGFIAGLCWLGHDEEPSRPASMTGLLLSMIATSATIVALNLIGQGAAPYWIITGVLATAVAWPWFVRHQRATPRPLVSMSSLRMPMLRPALAIFLLAAFAQTAAYIAIPFLLHDAGYKTLEIGMAFTAWPLAALAIAPFSTRACGRYRLALLGGIGMVVMSLGLLALGLVPAPPRWLAIALIALSGLGYGFYQIPNTQVLVTSVPVAQAADATAMGALSRALGQALGAAVVAFSLRLMGGDGANVCLALASAAGVAAALVSWRRPQGENIIGSPQLCACPVRKNAGVE